jgi:hypothetical protein
VSLLILAHLFCVAVVLFSNQFASVLQIRLVRTLAPYTRSLNFDPNFVAGFHLTHGMEYEDDHVIEVEWEGAQSVLRFPDDEGGETGWRGGFRRQRWRRLTQRMAAFASREDDTELAELSAAIGSHLLNAEGLGRITLRCRRRPSQPLGAVPGNLLDVDERQPYQTVYAADVFRDSSGTVRVIKQVATQEAAPVRNNSPGSSGSSGTTVRQDGSR